jgi:nitroreductase
VPLVSENEPIARLRVASRTTARPLNSSPDAPTLESVLRGRRSVRDFDGRPVPRDILANAIRTATAFDAAAFSRHTAAAPCVYLAAHRVEDLSPGLYQVGDLAGPAAPRVVPFPALDAMADAYCPAPAHFVVCGDIAAYCRSRGDEGYRGLLVRCGAFGYSLWLAARADGLEGTVFGRTAREITAALRKDSGTGVRHLFTVAVGHPLTGQVGQRTGKAAAG